MGTGVAMVVEGVGTVVVIAGCGGASCDELVHPALKISTVTMTRIPIIWTGFIGRQLLPVGKMVWLYCKMCHMGGFFYFRAFLPFENPTTFVIFQEIGVTGYFFCPIPGLSLSPANAVAPDAG